MPVPAAPVKNRFMPCTMAANTKSRPAACAMLKRFTVSLYTLSLAIALSRGIVKGAGGAVVQLLLLLLLAEATGDAAGAAAGRAGVDADAAAAAVAALLRRRVRRLRKRGLESPQVATRN